MVDHFSSSSADKDQYCTCDVQCKYSSERLQVIEYYVMRNSHFRIDLSNQSPQWSSHCERPFWFFLRFHINFDFQDIHSIYETGTNDQSRGDSRCVVFGVATWFLENQKKMKGTTSSHSTSIVPSRDSKFGRVHLLFDYFFIYNTRYMATISLQFQNNILNTHTCTMINKKSKEN